MVHGGKEQLVPAILGLGPSNNTLIALIVGMTNTEVRVIEIHIVMQCTYFRSGIDRKVSF